MDDIVSQVHKVNTPIAEIARAGEAQAASVNSVDSAVGHLDAMAQRNAELAEQSTAAAVTLRSQAEGLTRTVAVFDRGQAVAAAA